MQQLWTVREVASYLRVSQDHVRRLIRSGRLKAVRVGERALRVRESDVYDLLENATR